MWSLLQASMTFSFHFWYSFESCKLNIYIKNIDNNIICLEATPRIKVEKQIAK